MPAGPQLRATLLLAVLGLPGCGHVVTHELLVPVDRADDPEGVRIPCAQGHIRVYPVHINTQRGQPLAHPGHFTFAVEYSGTHASCSTGDVVLAGPGEDDVQRALTVVKSRRYPDRPGHLVCFYRMRNRFETGGIYLLSLYPDSTACTPRDIRYRYEPRREHRWPVMK